MIKIGNYSIGEARLKKVVGEGMPLAEAYPNLPSDILEQLQEDKYNILRQRNWRCDIQPAISELGYKPEYNLQRGVKETIKWYKDNKWL